MIVVWLSTVTLRSGVHNLFILVVVLLFRAWNSSSSDCSFFFLFLIINLPWLIKNWYNCEPFLRMSIVFYCMRFWYSTYHWESGFLYWGDLSVYAPCLSLFHFCPKNESDLSSGVLWIESVYVLTFLSETKILIFFS